MFVVFFPQDAYMPMMIPEKAAEAKGLEQVKKIVLKVKIV
ncbi:YhcH/YjgK/YiaL family protein [bacterium]|nr:YhcH/YjgK/YiaL family protein [bacterium]